MTDVQQTIAITVPLPPPSLRANSRAHYMTKKRDADEYSEYVWASVCQTIKPSWPFGPSWQRAHVVYEWRHAGIAPDHGNLGGHTKYLQDILCAAPENPGQDRWYLGLVEDDRGIEAEYRAVKVAHRRDEGVYVELRKVEP